LLVRTRLFSVGAVGRPSHPFPLSPQCCVVRARNDAGPCARDAIVVAGLDALPVLAHRIFFDVGSGCIAGIVIVRRLKLRSGN